MTKEEAISLLTQVNEILVNNNSWLESTHEPLNTAFAMAIKALEQEPCKDCISRQAVLEIQAKYAEYVGASKFWKMRDDIKALPPVTPQPKIGRWINQHVIYTNATMDFKVCSECRYEFSYDAETGVSDANYCPNCGAKMERQK